MRRTRMRPVIGFLTRVKLPSAFVLLLSALVAATRARADDKSATTGKSAKAGVENRNAEAPKGGDDKSSKAAESDKAKAVMAVMRRIAGELKVSAIDVEPVEAELIPEALFRSHDPARDIYDGSIWAYGKKGRPAAMLSLAFYPPANGKPGQWVHELNSLSTVRVEGKVPRRRAWSSRKPGLEFQQFPDAPAAAEKEAGRTRQLRDLSARFTAFEMLLTKGPDAPPERFELRLIPRPIHRYSDPERGQVDGALLLMTSATNPEIVMVIELVREGDKNVWKYGFNRIAWAELHVHLDGKEIWTQPHLSGTSPAEPYWLYSTPIAPGELELE